MCLNVSPDGSVLMKCGKCKAGEERLTHNNFSGRIAPVAPPSRRMCFWVIGFILLSEIVRRRCLGTFFLNLFVVVLFETLLFWPVYSALFLWLPICWFASNLAQVGICIKQQKMGVLVPSWLFSMSCRTGWNNSVEKWCHLQSVSQNVLKKDYLKLMLYSEGSEHRFD